MKDNLKPHADRGFHDRRLLKIPHPRLRHGTGLSLRPVRSSTPCGFNNFAQGRRHRGGAGHPAQRVEHQGWSISVRSVWKTEARGRGSAPLLNAYDMLSRKVVEVQGEGLIIGMPRSSKSARESLEALFPRMLYLYALPTMTGCGQGKKNGHAGQGQRE